MYIIQYIINYIRECACWTSEKMRFSGIGGSEKVERGKVDEETCRGGKGKPWIARYKKRVKVELHLV